MQGLNYKFYLTELSRHKDRFTSIVLGEGSRHCSASGCSGSGRILSKNRDSRVINQCKYLANYYSLTS